MKDYYQILRVGRQASAGDIKRAYRKLAIVFHPDKNQSSESSSLFQEINEAHEVLSDPDKRLRYDQLLNNIYSSETVDMPPQQWHRDPAYRRRQQTGYRPKPAQPSERMLMMAHLLKFLRPVALTGMGWCAFLLIDYSLPFKISDEKVLRESDRINSWQFHHTPDVVVTDQAHQFPVSPEGAKFFKPGTYAKVYTSKVLNVIVKVESENKGFTITSLGSVYQNFVFMPVILFMLSLAGLLIKNGIEFRFSFQVAICMVLFFNVIFLVVSIL